MIDEALVAHATGPVSVGIGSCGKNLRPHFLRAWGVNLDRAANTLTMVVSDRPSAALTLADLAENPRIAVVVGDASNFRSYQYKGTVLSIVPADETDRVLVDRLTASMGPLLTQFVPAPVAATFIGAERFPALRITVRVDEVFHQTPGAGTGGSVS